MTRTMRKDPILFTVLFWAQIATAQYFTNPWPWFLPERTSALPHSDLRALLSAGADVFEHDEDGYRDLTRRWQKYQSPSFDVAVAVDSEQDVVKTIRYANDNGLPFLAYTGGHGATNSLSTIQSGIQINMRKLNHVRVESCGKTATIGGGATTIEVTAGLWAAGKQTVTGMCECTSIVAPMLGGGHGLLQGQYGLAADQLVSARLMLANGTAVVASNTSHPDLFWALRGAGHNFGIVTEMVYKIYDVEPGKEKWTKETFLFDSASLEEVFRASNRLLEIQPPGMLHFAFFLRLPDIDPAKTMIMMVVLYNGPPYASRKYTQSFHDLLPLSASTDEVEYPDHPAAVLSSQKDLACQKLGDSSSALRFPIDLKSYNISAMRSIYEIFDNGITNEPRLSTSLMMIEGYSVQGVQAIPANSTAVPFRAERLLLSPTIFFSDTGGPNLQAIAISWGKNIREVLREGEGETLSYVNYAHGDEGPGAWYGHEHWRIEKLETLKKVWDPQNKFGGYAPIPVD